MSRSTWLTTLTLSIHGLKSIGYVQLIVSPTYTQSRQAPEKPRASIPEKKGEVADTKAATAVAIAVVVLAAAFCLPYFSYPISLRSFAK